MRKSTRQLPDRYRIPWRGPFNDAAKAFFSDGMTVLDVGSGREPSFSPDVRPEGTVYVGADISAAELERAGDVYDGAVVSDIRTYDKRLDCGFDLAVSFQVLEHIKPLANAIDNIHSYLRPGGTFVTQLSGGLAVFALLNRIVPAPVAKQAMYLLLDRPKDSVFPATYDKCTKNGLEKLFSDWSEVKIEPRWIGGNYFRFARPIESLYLRYEEWAIRREFVNLAPFFVVTATKS